MQRLCVYCGSNPGRDERYAAVAQALGATLVSRGIDLVYGGGATGLMGRLADSVLQHGGRVTGVIPEALYAKEVAHERLTELHVVSTMHERKALMAELADGFVAMPGGFGTLEEIIEIVTWGQLRFHAKPCGLLNVDGYFDALLAFLDHAHAEGFLRAENRAMLLHAADADGLLAALDAYTAPTVDKWQQARAVSAE